MMKNRNNTAELIKQVAIVAIPFANTLVREWLPEGKQCGSEWEAVNTARGDRVAGSFGVSLITGQLLS